MSARGLELEDARLVRDTLVKIDAEGPEEGRWSYEIQPDPERRGRYQVSVTDESGAHMTNIRSLIGRGCETF